MRYIVCHSNGDVFDTGTGELTSKISLEQLLLKKPGGIIVGNNLYPVISSFVPEQRKDTGWTSSLSLQRKKQIGNRVGGIIYYRHLTYRFPKERGNALGSARRYRPASIKWLVFNLELWTEVKDSELLLAAETLVEISKRRGIGPRSSPGSFGSALLRSSPMWLTGRNPAPRFISEIGRERQPGNHYQLRNGYTRVPRAYYLDQQSAHHRIASQIALPHPDYLRARGLTRAIKDDVGGGRRPKWLQDVNNLQGHSGLLCCVIEVDTIPLQIAHLYPEWCKGKGKQVDQWGKRKVVWIFTPELRLLDSRVKLRWISGAFTSYVPDPALAEYSRWAMEFLETNPHPIAKPTLHAPYGMLGVRAVETVDKYSLHARGKPERADIVRFPLIGDVYRSTINRNWTPVLQNVVARGVLEAETLTRSIEFARQLEAEGYPVIQIYADGVITTAPQLPFMPDGWRVAAELTGVTSPHPNSIQSNEMIRLPGIPHGRRMMVKASGPSDADRAVIERAHEEVAALDARDLL